MNPHVMLLILCFRYLPKRESLPPTHISELVPLYPNFHMCTIYIIGWHVLHKRYQKLSLISSLLTWHENNETLQHWGFIVQGKSSLNKRVVIRKWCHHNTDDKSNAFLWLYQFWLTLWKYLTKINLIQC